MRFLILLGICFYCQAGEHLSISGTYYVDDREYDTLNLTTSAQLPFGLSLWGFTDFHSYQGNDYGDFDRTFSEYRLSYPIKNGFGIQGEYNRSTPSNVDMGRFGITYKHSIPKVKGWMQWRLFPIETDGNGGQMSLIYFLPLTEKFSITGFADINWDEENSDRWVIEPQLNYKVNESVSVHIEYRYNGFEDINLDGKGVAIGISFKF
jgi:predicted porin